MKTAHTENDSAFRTIDAVVLVLLLAIACVPFYGAIRHPANIPEGMDFTQHYSREAVIRLAMHTTWLPLWNPYEFSGFPLQADLQTGVFYPPSVVLRLLPIASFLTWTVIFHIWMFGAGSYFLCRTLRAGRAASTIAAIGLMLGGITVPRVYAGHLDVLRTLAWIPLVIACGVRSIDRRTVLPTALAVVALALELLAGFLQLVCYTVAVIGLYAIFSAIWPASGRRSLRAASTVGIQLAVMVVLTLGLTAFQLLPSARLVRAAGRTQGISLESAVESSVALNDLSNMMLWPAMTGDIEKQSWETSAFVGWPLMLLAPFALFATGRRRLVLFFMLVGGFALAFATGGSLYEYHHALFPMFRIPGRLMCLWSISVGVLGAVTLDHIGRWLAGPPGIISAPSMRFRQMATVLLFVIVGSVVGWDGLRYASHFTTIQPLRERFATSIPFTPSKFGRVLSLCENRLQTSEITALGVPSVDGYNSYFLFDYARLAQREVKEAGSQLTSFPRMGSSGRIGDVGVLNLLNVTEIVSCERLEAPGLELIGQSRPFFVYRNHQALGRITHLCAGENPKSVAGTPDCSDNVEAEILTTDDPKGLMTARVVVSEPTTLVLSEPFYTERRAWVDGVRTPVEKVSVAMSGVRVGAGTHEIRLRLVPTSLYYGILITAATLALWLAAVRRFSRDSQAELPLPLVV